MTQMPLHFGRNCVHERGSKSEGRRAVRVISRFDEAGPFPRVMLSLTCQIPTALSCENFDPRLPCILFTFTPPLPLFFTKVNKITIMGYKVYHLR